MPPSNPPTLDEMLASERASAREWEARARATAEAHGAACRRVLELEESIAEMREKLGHVRGCSCRLVMENAMDMNRWRYDPRCALKEEV